MTQTEAKTLLSDYRKAKEAQNEAELGKLTAKIIRNIDQKAWPSDQLYIDPTTKNLLIYEGGHAVFALETTQGITILQEF
jgi:hypothetical protein